MRLRYLTWSAVHVVTDAGKSWVFDPWLAGDTKRGVPPSPVEGVRGHRYERPLSLMRSYLDAMDRAPFIGAQPSLPPLRVIGALHPKMLALSAERAAGAHPYFVPPEHTARARQILGTGPLLAPEQAVVLDTDPTSARTTARAHMAIYLGLPNYARNLLRHGFDAADLAGPSPRLVDAIVVCGSVDDVVRRVGEQHDAGADHVCIQVLTPRGGELPMRQWTELAEALGLRPWTV